jgi:hypothetical protein
MLLFNVTNKPAYWVEANDLHSYGTHSIRWGSMPYPLHYWGA